MKLSSLIFLFILSSCSCNWHLDKAAKKCGSHVIRDTIHIRDTVIIKSDLKDTIFKHTHFYHDTTILREGRLTVKYFYNTHDSTVYLAGKCAADTVYKTIKVPYDKIVLETNWFDKFKWFIYIGGLLVFLYFITKLFAAKK